VLALLGGCLTPSMGKKADVVLGLVDRPRVVRRASSPLDTEGMPRRLWYADEGARIYHERRTNTFVAWDESKKGWIAIPERDAYERFRPARAKLLPEGAPPAVEKILDYLLEMEPGWRGA
jgi:hypothetical protein